jgi:hypothetical protein
VASAAGVASRGARMCSRTQCASATTHRTSAAFSASPRESAGKYTRLWRTRSRLRFTMEPHSRRASSKRAALLLVRNTSSSDSAEEERPSGPRPMEMSAGHVAARKVSYKSSSSTDSMEKAAGGSRFAKMCELRGHKAASAWGAARRQPRERTLGWMLSGARSA